MLMDCPRRAVSRLARVRALRPTDQRGRLAVAIVLALTVMVAAMLAVNVAMAVVSPGAALAMR